MLDPEIALVYADQYYSQIPNQTFEEVLSSKKTKLYSFPDYNYFHQLDRCLVCSQPMWRASLHFEDNIWFDEKYEICGDYDFNMKVTQNYKMLHLPEVLGVFYRSPQKENLSLKDSRKATDEIREISAPYLKAYVASEGIEELDKYSKNFMNYLKVPLPIFYLWKRFRLFLKPGLIKDKFFHSIEFMAFYCILVLKKENKTKGAVKLGKRVLRYQESKRIQKELKALIKKY